LKPLPALDGKIVTADPWHCQRQTARGIVDQGGDYLFQIKGNQPKLLEQAKKLDALKGTPFCPQPKQSRAGEHLARPRLCTRGDDCGLSLCAKSDRRAERADEQEERREQ
jgi:hypothetical protein